VIAELKKLGEAYSGSALAARRLDLIKYGSYLKCFDSFRVAVLFGCNFRMI
jgi:hypothetical protein